MNRKVTKTLFKPCFFLSLLLISLIVLIPEIKVVNAYFTDFTTWTEYDPSNKLTQTSSRANWTNLNIKDDSYLYKAITSGLSFTHHLDFRITYLSGSSSGYILGCLWAVCENYGRPYYSEVGAVVALGFKSWNTSSFWLYIDNSGYEDDESIDLVVDTTYYLTVNRTDPIFMCLIYSDIGRTTLLDTISINVTGFDEEGFTFNYLETTAGYDYDLAGDRYSSGYVEKLDAGGCMVTSSPELNVDFTLNETAHVTPYYEYLTEGNYTFICQDLEIQVNSTYKYVFEYWSINGSGAYYSSNIDVEIKAATNLTMHYVGSWIEAPFIPDFTKPSRNVTWYMRSDTHTIHDQLSYRLDIVNTKVETYDSRSTSGSVSISYGIRAWAIDILGNSYELSGGSPEAIVSRSTDGKGMQSAYFNCPAHSNLIDAIQVNVYHRFGNDPWSLRRIFISEEDLYWKLPAAQWTIYYHTNRTTASTTAYFHHGSSGYPSRLTLIYYRANPWEVAMARLQAQNYLGFLFTPWTYYLGDLFWSLALLFCIVTAYNRFGSLKPILALLWLFGGVGSFLSTLIPAFALPIAWLMLAVAMGITLFKLAYR